MCWKFRTQKQFSIKRTPVKWADRLLLLMLFFMEAEFMTSALASIKASLLAALTSSKLVWLTEAPSSRSSLSRLVWRSQNFVDAFVPILWKHSFWWWPCKRERRIKGYSSCQRADKKNVKINTAYCTMQMKKYTDDIIMLW